MLTLMKMDLKQRLKNSLTWFVILILCIMSMLSIIEMKNARFLRPFKGHDIYSFVNKEIMDWDLFFTRRYGEREKELYPQAYYSLGVYKKVQEDLVIAIEENDVREITRLMSFFHLLWAKQEYITHDAIMNKIFENRAMKIWNDVSDGIPYEDMDFRPYFGGSETRVYALLYAKYYHQLYINDIEPVYSNDINNVTYLYEYFFSILPKFIIVIPILFIYNSINREKNGGSLKLVLTQSISRWKYYLSKWLSGTIHVIFTLFFPAIIISTLLGVINGFVSLKYPTFYLKNSMSGFKTIPNYMDAVKMKKGNFEKFGGYNATYSYMAPKSSYDVNIVDPHEKMEIIPFYKYLLMAVLLSILFITFVVALTQLISAIVNKEIISITTISIIFGIGILISSPFKYDKHLNLSPFTMEHASRILIGTYNVTALASTIILFVSTTILLIAGVVYFKRKEI
ncbi:MAG: hypothetical protein EWM50_00325 [Gottschalkiaceae bacterium]|nr:MAG: hypothetical protein EWM50_00325 [Gottschalkiaceae bacterium]